MSINHDGKKAKIIELLKRNSRMSLTEISRLTGIPVSTVFDYLKRIDKEYVFTVIERNILR